MDNWRIGNHIDFIFFDAHGHYVILLGHQIVGSDIIGVFLSFEGEIDNMRTETQASFQFLIDNVEFRGPTLRIDFLSDILEETKQVLSFFVSFEFINSVGVVHQTKNIIVSHLLQALILLLKNEFLFDLI